MEGWIPLLWDIKQRTETLKSWPCTGLATLGTAFLLFSKLSSSDSTGTPQQGACNTSFLGLNLIGERERGLKNFCPSGSDNQLGNACRPRAPGGRCQGRVGEAYWPAPWGPHPPRPGAQGSPKGSHCIQNKVNEYIPSLVLSLNPKPKLLGVIL